MIKNVLQCFAFIVKLLTDSVSSLVATYNIIFQVSNCILTSFSRSTNSCVIQKQKLLLTKWNSIKIIDTNKREKGNSLNKSTLW